MHRKQKPTVLVKEQYKKLTSVLNTLVIATKLNLKQKVRLSKKPFTKLKEHSLTKEYKELRKRLDHAKKLYQCWEDCIAL